MSMEKINEQDNVSPEMTQNDENTAPKSEVIPERYLDTQPLVDVNNQQEIFESISADNSERFNNTTQYSEKTEEGHKKKEKTSKFIQAIQNTPKIRVLAKPLSALEKGFIILKSLFRYDAIFFSKKLPIYLLNLFLFFMAYGFVLYQFYQQNYFVLPLFFVIVDCIYHRIDKKKYASLILSQNLFYCVPLATLSIILAIIPYLGLDHIFSYLVHQAVNAMALLVTIMVGMLCYFSVRKHFWGAIFMFATFLGVGYQYVSVINWNEDLKSSSASYRDISRLSYNLYKRHPNSAIELVQPIGFVKIDAKNKKNAWELFSEVVYNYRIDFSALEKIKNAKCLKYDFNYCSQNPELPKFILNKSEARYIDNIQDYKALLNYTFSQEQVKFLQELEFEIKLPFRAEHYIYDLTTLYQIHLNSAPDLENDKTITPTKSVKEKLGLDKLNAKFESIFLNQTLMQTR